MNTISKSILIHRLDIFYIIKRIIPIIDMRNNMITDSSNKKSTISRN